jgi:AhpD family alkylhydroperoxidase
MDARLNYFASPTAGKALKYFMSVGRELKESPLPATTQELVALRVSQINGCAVCIDMHTKEAAAAGESPVRLNLIAAWREATVFTEAERAALALAGSRGPGSRTRPPGSATRCGRVPPSTMTRSSSRPSCCWSRS